MKKEKRMRISIHDINRKKLCEIYDSENAVQGEAEEVSLTCERSGWKTLSFDMQKYLVDGNENFRCGYLKNEYCARVVLGDETDWFTLTVPDIKHNGKKLTCSVSCDHVSGELKTRNLFGYFDEENGIDTCPTLIGRALTGTGWTLTACDRLLEPDGQTEKIRSFTCSEKTGAWKMVTDICTLFQAYPVFHGDDRTVEVHALNNHPSVGEIYFGKNTSQLEKKPDSANIVTRLYVQGDYTDDGYVGIDDAAANTHHLNFICNFDYYKKLGVFTDAHQTALDAFLEEKAENNAELMSMNATLMEKQRAFDTAIGTYPAIYYAMEGGRLNIVFEINDPTDQQKELHSEDSVALVKTRNDIVESYKYVTVGDGLDLTGVAFVVKFPVTMNGL